MTVVGRAAGGAAVAVGVTSAALVAAIPAVPVAAAAPYTVLAHCTAGSGTVTASVDCRDADTPLVADALAAAAPQIVSLLGSIGVQPTSTAAVILGDGTARIHGTGLAVGVQTGSAGLLGIPGGSADANAVTPLSGAVAGAFLRGSAHATAVSGVSVALSGSGTATAVAVGGSATALDALGARAVRCVALYASASADGVGSCTSVLVVFTAENTAGSPVWTYALVDPTSFRVTTIGVVPVPEFTRDLVRVSVGGPSGVTFGSDVIPGGPVTIPTAVPTTVSSRAVSSPAVSAPAVTVSARTALAKEPAPADAAPTLPDATITPTAVASHRSTERSFPTTTPAATQPISSPPASTDPVAVAVGTTSPGTTTAGTTTAGTTTSGTTAGRHAKDDSDTSAGFSVRSHDRVSPASGSQSVDEP